MHNRIVKSIAALEALGFKRLTKERFLSLMDNETFQFVDETAHHLWLVFEGDLQLMPAQVKLFSALSLLVLGDLTVKGVFDYRTVSALFVLGEMRAKSLLLSSSTCYFARTTYFDEALIVMGGSGAPVQINNTQGLLVYNDADAADITVDPQQVSVFVDHCYGESFGSVETLLDSQFLQRLEFADDEVLFRIKTDALCNAIVEGEAIIKTG